MRSDSEKYGEFWRYCLDGDLLRVQNYLKVNPTNLKVMASSWLESGDFDLATVSLKRLNLFKLVYGYGVSFAHVQPSLIADAMEDEEFSANAPYLRDDFFHIADNKGYTAMFYVKSLKACQIMLNCGANIRIITKDGKNIIDTIRGRAEFAESDELRAIDRILTERDSFGGSVAGRAYSSAVVLGEAVERGPITPAVSLDEIEFKTPDGRGCCIA